MSAVAQTETQTQSEPVEHSKPVNRDRLEQYVDKERARLIFEQVQKESKYFCDPFTRSFVRCVERATYLTPFKCREENKELHYCMKEYIALTDFPRLGMDQPLPKFPGKVYEKN